MSDSELKARLESLEIRYSHQEQALEELTRSLLRQEDTLKRQGTLIERLEKALKAMESGAADLVPGEEKPPHY